MVVEECFWAVESVYLWRWEKGMYLPEVHLMPLMKYLYIMKMDKE